MRRKYGSYEKIDTDREWEDSPNQWETHTASHLSNDQLYWIHTGMVFVFTYTSLKPDLFRLKRT